jgi:hypothetical protein
MRFELKLWGIYFFVFVVAIVVILLVDRHDLAPLEIHFQESLQNLGQTVHFSTHTLSGENGIPRMELEEFITEARKNKSIKEISIINSSQEVVASSNPGKIGERSDFLDSEIVLREEWGGVKNGWMVMISSTMK